MLCFGLCLYVANFLFGGQLIFLISSSTNDLHFWSGVHGGGGQWSSPVCPPHHGMKRLNPTLGATCWGLNCLCSVVVRGPSVWRSTMHGDVHWPAFSPHVGPSSNLLSALVHFLFIESEPRAVTLPMSSAGLSSSFPLLTINAVMHECIRFFVEMTRAFVTGQNICRK